MQYDVNKIGSVYEKAGGLQGGGHRVWSMNDSFLLCNPYSPTPKPQIMKVSVHQPQYIPWLGYFDKIDKSDCFVFLDTVQYKIREYQNRNSYSDS